VKVIPVSAKGGIGMDELRAEIASRVAAKRSTTARVEADLTGAARRLEEAGGAGRTRELAAEDVRRLEDAVADASGVPSTVAGVERSVREQAARATTWPPLALVGRSGGGAHRSGLGEEVGTGMARLRGATGAARVARPVLDVEVLTLADAAADGIGPQWAESVRRAATARTPEAADRVDAGLAQVDLGVDRLPAWVPLLRIVQWLLLLAALVGAGWWGYLAVRGTVDDAPQVTGLPVPAVLLVGGLVLGLALAGVARGLATGLARRRAAAADERLRGVVSTVLDEEIVGPVSEALARYTTFRTGLAAALR
jgi:hypothetical protein